VEALKQKHTTAFNVVFQKSFIRAASEMCHYADALAGMWGIDEVRFLPEWSARFNVRISPGLLAQREDWWIGSGRRADGTIDFTQRGANSITGFVVTMMLAPVDDWKSNVAKRAIDKQATDWLLKTAWPMIKKGAKGSPMDYLISSQGKYYREALESLAKADAALKNKTLSVEEARSAGAQFGGAQMARFLA
jgi:hypothetical protein